MIKNLWFNCLNLLPISIDESITEYELLCKITKSVNLIIDDVNKINEIINSLNTNMESLKKDFETLKNYVDNYFDNLDLQKEVNKKIEEMKMNGELTGIITDNYSESTFFSSMTSFLLESNLYKIREVIGILTGKTQNKIKILFVGDSTTAGTDIIEFNQWTTLFKKQICNIQAEFFNYGVPNASLNDFNNPSFNFPGTQTPWRDLCKNVNADVIIAFWGVNEWINYTPWLQTNRFYNNIVKFKDYLQTATNSIYYVTPEMVNTNAAPVNINQNKYLSDMSEVLRHATEKLGYNVMDFNALAQACFLGTNPFVYDFGSAYDNVMPTTPFRDFLITINIASSFDWTKPQLPILQFRGANATADSPNYFRISLALNSGNKQIQITSNDSETLLNVISFNAYSPSYTILVSGSETYIGGQAANSCYVNIFEGYATEFFSDENVTYSILPLTPSVITTTPINFDYFFGGYPSPQYGYDGNGFTHPCKRGTFMFASFMKYLANRINKETEINTR